MTVLRVGYKAGARFDHAYYTSTHLPLASEVMGPYGVKNVEVVTFGPNPDGSHPPYQVMFSAYFTLVSEVQNALQSPRMAEVLADIPNYHDAVPDLMIGEVTTLGG